MSTRVGVQPLVDSLRTKGLTRLQIADDIRRRFKVNAMVAIRMAHGWSQQQAADAWNAKWPGDDAGKTFKNFAYWEAWPSSAGYPPALPVLVRLAELYQVAVSDLLDSAGDFRHLDDNYPGRDPLGSIVEVAQPNGVESAEERP